MFGVRARTSVARAAIACAALAVGSAGVAAQGNPPATPPPAQQPSAQAPPAQAPAAQPGQNEAQPQVTNVGGRWELNWQQSDKPPDSAGQPGRGEPGEGGGGGGRRGGGGGGGGMGGRMGRGGGMMGRGGGGERGGRVDESARESMRELLQAPRTLVIVEHPDRISITDENGQIEKLEPNGQKMQVERAGKSTQETTRWDGRTLVTETALSDGTKVTRTYQKAAEGLQLIVTTKVEGSRMGRTIELKRVYDQALQDK